MPGRGLGIYILLYLSDGPNNKINKGERLAIDPNNNDILFFGARSGHGLYKSTNAGATWANITTFPSVGTYIPDPTDTTVRIEKNDSC